MDARQHEEDPQHPQAHHAGRGGAPRDAAGRRGEPGHPRDERGERRDDREGGPGGDRTPAAHPALADRVRDVDRREPEQRDVESEAPRQRARGRGVAHAANRTVADHSGGTSFTFTTSPAAASTEPDHGSPSTVAVTRTSNRPGGRPRSSNSPPSLTVPETER